MIDIGLTKLAVIGVVALVVVGPERLPTVARMAGTLFGRAQRYLNQVKSEVSREIELDELRRMQQEMQQAAGNVKQDIEKEMRQTEHTIHSAWNDSGDDTLVNPLLDVHMPEQFAMKAKTFRRKKLARTAAVPSWYKLQSGRRTRVISAAARVAKYRPAVAGKSRSSFF